MTEQLKESLSAVLDDAADAFELRRVLDETSRNDSLRETLERYQLVKSVLRRESSAQTLRDRVSLQRRVRESLDVAIPDIPNEEVVEPMATPPSASKTRWPLGIGAAAVVLVAASVLYWGSSGSTPESAAPGIVAIPPVETQVVANRARARDVDGSGRSETVDAAVVRRHERYLTFHHRFGTDQQPDAGKVAEPTPAAGTDR